MPSVRALVAVTALSAATAACRTQTVEEAHEGADSTVLAVDPAATRDVLLVYMGGFNSCGSDTPRKLAAIGEFEALKSSLEGRGKTVHYVLSCYNGMSSTVIRWLSSAEPDNVYGVSWDFPTEGGQLFDEVKSLSANFRRPVFVIGHSYGGWLSSNLVAHLAREGGDAAKGAIGGLYTIDPISPYHCNQGLYAATVARSFSILGAFAGPGGCEMAPPQYVGSDDVTYPANILNDSGGRIVSHVMTGTRRWVSFYQERDYLHSSAIARGSLGGLVAAAVAGALGEPGRATWPENVRISYGAFLIGTSSAPHVRIHTEGEVWRAIGDGVRATLGLGLGLTEGGDTDVDRTITIEGPSQRPEHSGYKPPTPQQLSELKSMLETAGKLTEEAPLSNVEARKVEEIYGETASTKAKASP